MKRGKGRPPTGTKIEVRVPDDMLAVLDERAAAANISRPELIRRILADGLARNANSAPDRSRGR